MREALKRHLELIAGEIIQPQGLCLVSHCHGDRGVRAVGNPAQVDIAERSGVKIVLDLELAPIEQAGAEYAFEAAELAFLHATTAAGAIEQLIECLVAVLDGTTSPDMQRAKEFKAPFSRTDMFRGSVVSSCNSVISSSSSRLATLIRLTYRNPETNSLRPRRRDQELRYRMARLLQVPSAKSCGVN